MGLCQSGAQSKPGHLYLDRVYMNRNMRYYYIVEAIFVVVKMREKQDGWTDWRQVSLVVRSAVGNDDGRRLTG